MEEKKLQVQLFGKCAVTEGEHIIQDTGKRINKIWLLIAYFISNRGRNLSQEELIDNLWGRESGSNPNGTLKTTLWRARSLLDELWPSAGHDLILNKNNGYEWNTDVPIEVDVTTFENLCCNHRELPEQRIEDLRKAVALYQGDFLEKYCAEDWVGPLTAYYNSMYVQIVLELISLLPLETHAKEVADLARIALKLSPYQEELYQHLMNALVQMGELKQADAVYEELRDLLYKNLGISPGEEVKELHTAIVRDMNDHSLTPDMLREQLLEKDPAPGPLFCEFPVFRQFYQAEARSVSRRGDAVHVAMLTITTVDDSVLSENVTERVMMQLRDQIRGGLRRGDVVSRCSASQYVILLLQANFENSNMVCDRIIRSFMNANPRTKVRVRSDVLPVEPLQTAVTNAPPKKVRWNR
ncbi:MAG: hypothetical protein IIV43_00945 [Oscillospiraceae bacterium]|nr:hypothetical protein [Oscillospiraceae bacterium]